LIIARRVSGAIIDRGQMMNLTLVTNIGDGHCMLLDCGISPNASP